MHLQGGAPIQAYVHAHYIIDYVTYSQSDSEARSIKQDYTQAS